jgi:hypothetical protein
MVAIRDYLFDPCSPFGIAAWFAFWIVVLVLDRFLDLLEGV